MRSYGQYCAVAKALDVIGDRWNLLIVRELLLRGACRYTDLLDGLPGIATNLLADRLRGLEQVGVLSREDAPPPIATTLFRLTSRGEELKTVLVELGRWGSPLMAEPVTGEAFRGHWLSFPVDVFLADNQPDGPPLEIEVRLGGEPMTIEALEGELRVRQGAAADPDLILSGTPQIVLGALTGKLALEDGQARGLQFEGDVSALARVQAGGSPGGDDTRPESSTDRATQPVDYQLAHSTPC
jgi:DNA-binding HxlR family transcriptional regulator